MTEFALTTEARDAGTRIRVRGELDIATAPRLEQELRAHGGAATVVLDLREVTFLDSSGLRAVIVGSQEAVAAGRRLVVVPGEGQAARVIEMAQVGGHLELAAGGDAP